MKEEKSITWAINLSRYNKLDLFSLSDKKKTIVNICFFLLKKKQSWQFEKKNFESMKLKKEKKNYPAWFNFR